jgi:hypothetical protein
MPKFGVGVKSNKNSDYSRLRNAHLLRIPYEYDSGSGRFLHGKTFNIAPNRYYERSPDRE